MMPVVTVAPLPSDRPSALPIATTASPTWSVVGVAELERRQAGLVDLHDREVEARVGTDDVAGERAAVGEVHHHLVLHLRRRARS